MSTYLVGPFIEADAENVACQVETSTFIERFQQRWPDVEIHEITEPEQRQNVVVEWFDLRINGNVDGWLFRDKRGISLDGDDLNDMAEVALWFRSLIPATCRLLFFDESFNDSIELRLDTTKEDIMKALG